MFNLVSKYGARSLALAILAAATIAAAPASAQHGGWRGGGGWHGGYHGGWHGGWGWGVSVGFYDPWWPGYYAGYPYYSYAYDPPVTVVQQAVPAQQAPAAPASWYYCDNPAGYYPYVQNCSSPWRPVPATPPPQQR